jgi:O-antigen/teichoic acid export membrane protein
MSLGKTVALNTFWQVLAKVFSTGFSLLTVLLLTGYLGPAGYGDYMFITSAVIIFGGFADWGTATIGVRELSTRLTGKRPVFLGNLIILRFLLALASLLLFVIFALIFPLKTDNLFLVRLALATGGLMLLSNNLKSSFAVAFQSNLKMEKQALVQTSAAFLVFVFTFIFIKLNFSFWWLILSLVLASFSTVFVAGCLFFKQEKVILKIDRQILKTLLSESLPMGLILLFFTLDRQIDTLILAALKGSGPVGIYGLSGKINDVVVLGAAFLMNALLPVLSRTKKENRRIKEIFNQVFWSMFLLGLIAGLFVFLFSPLMIKTLTQKSFADFTSSILVLRIFSLSLFFAYFNHLAGFTLIAFGKQRSYLYVAVGALIFNLLANLWAISFYSFFGAAWVTVFTELIVLFSTFWLLKKQLNLYPRKGPMVLIDLVKRQFHSLRK